jgi:hypothetical protein
MDGKTRNAFGARAINFSPRHDVFFISTLANSSLRVAMQE